jgi:hypothetical protein
MSGSRPQNPVFDISPQTAEACAPRVVCPACGTILPVKARRADFRRRCISCKTMLLYKLDGAEWQVCAAVEDEEAPTPT